MTEHALTRTHLNSHPGDKLRLDASESLSEPQQLAEGLTDPRARICPFSGEAPAVPGAADGSMVARSRHHRPHPHMGDGGTDDGLILPRRGHFRISTTSLFRLLAVARYCSRKAKGSVTERMQKGSCPLDHHLRGPGRSRSGRLSSPSRGWPCGRGTQALWVSQADGAHSGWGRGGGNPGARSLAAPPSQARRHQQQQPL